MANNPSMLQYLAQLSYSQSQAQLAQLEVQRQRQEVAADQEETNLYAQAMNPNQPVPGTLAQQAGAAPSPQPPTAAQVPGGTPTATPPPPAPGGSVDASGGGDDGAAPAPPAAVPGGQAPAPPSAPAAPAYYPPAQQEVAGWQSAQEQYNKQAQATQTIAQRMMQSTNPVTRQRGIKLAQTAAQMTEKAAELEDKKQQHAKFMAQDAADQAAGVAATPTYESLQAATQDLRNRYGAPPPGWPVVPPGQTGALPKPIVDQLDAVKNRYETLHDRVAEATAQASQQRADANDLKVAQGEQRIRIMEAAEQRRAREGQERDEKRQVDIEKEREEIKKIQKQTEALDKKNRALTPKEQETKGDYLALVNGINDLESFIKQNQNKPIFGVAGKVSRPLESLGNISGTSDATTAHDLQTKVKDLQDRYRQFFKVHGARLKADQAKEDVLIRGMSLGDTAQNALSSLQEARSRLSDYQEKVGVNDDEFESGRARDADAGAGSAPQIPDVGTVQKGYVFLGGDPADPKSWAKANK